MADYEVSTRFSAVCRDVELIVDIGSDPAPTLNYRYSPHDVDSYAEADTAGLRRLAAMLNAAADFLDNQPIKKVPCPHCGRDIHPKQTTCPYCIVQTGFPQ